MPDLIGRLWSTAENMRQYPGVDEPLLIHEHELPEVAKYAAKLARVRVQNMSGIERMLRDGLLLVFGRRVHILH